MRVLITNDDGIDSPGLHILAKVAAEAGLDVVVAAPHMERSGSSASLVATRVHVHVAEPLAHRLDRHAQDR